MSGDEYSLVITLKKFVFAWITAFIGIIIPFTITFVQDYEWPQEILIYLPIIIAALVAIENAYKHWND